MSSIEQSFGLDVVRPATLALAGCASSPSRLRWLVGRLVAMERREVSYRVRALAKTYVDLLNRCGSAGETPDLDPNVPAAFLTRERAAAVARLTPAAAIDAARAAEELRRGRFQLLGYPPVALDRPIRYDVDPFTGRAWPARHGLLVDYRSSDVGDPKWAWELNRLQHVPLLLSVALYTGEEPLVSCAVGDLEAWLCAERFGRGIAWSNGYEPALRAISAALAVDALRSLPEHHSVARAAIRSLSEHVRWIRRYPSLFSSANNHRIGELAGIIVSACLVPEIEADAEPELCELRLRCAEQYAGDGGHREQSFGYAVFTTELLVTAVAALEARRGRAPDWLRNVVASARDAISLQVGEIDPEPRFGDRDDGGPLLLSATGGRSGRSLLATIDHWQGRDVREGDLDPTAVWLFGERKSETPRRRSDTSGILEESGIVVLRRGATTATVDIGGHGFGRLAAHGHADALHVTLSRRGQLLVGDPGTGSYFGNPAVRDCFRSTRFHSTVEVDGEDQGIVGGPFLWRTVPRVDDVEVDLDACRASASHDGYERLADPVRHARTVMLVDEELLLVCDELSAEVQHTYVQTWTLPPDVRLESLDDGRAAGAAGDIQLTVATASSARVSSVLRAGSIEPFAGWWSDGLEAIRPCPFLGFATSQPGRAMFVTAIGMEATAAPLHVVPEDARRFSVTTGGSTWMVTFDGRGIASATASMRREPTVVGA